MKLVNIEATTLPDAWFQSLYKIMEQDDKGEFVNARKYKIDQGSYEGQFRLQFDYVTIHIKYPTHKPIMPIADDPSLAPMMPYGQEDLDNYYKLILTDHKEDNQEYTYGERFHNPKAIMPLSNIFKEDMIKEENGTKILDYNGQKIPLEEILNKNVQKVKLPNEQFINNNTIKIKETSDQKEEYYEIPFNSQPIETIIKRINDYGPGNNQLVAEVGMPSDVMLKDPPCLRFGQTSVIDDKINMMMYFRSWDLYSGMPLNLPGLLGLQEYIAVQTGYDVGEMIAASGGLHIYDHFDDVAAIVTHKSK